MENEKIKVTYGIVQFVVNIIVLIVAALLFYGAIDKRVTVVETRLEQKIELNQVIDRIDKLELKLENKIENEIKKLRQ